MSTIMKKLFNLNYIVLLAVLALFSACTEDNEYVPAGPCAETNAYRFAADQNVAPVLALTDSVYVVTLERDNTEEEVTVALNVKGDTDMLKAPSTVTFAAGEAQVSLNIEIAPSMEALKNYYLEISIEESLVNPYLPANNSIFSLTVLKEDYKPFAAGNYTSWLFEQTWPAVLEYSPMLDLYRFKDCWVKGDVTFRVTNPETMEFEMTASSFGTGYLYNGQVEVVATVQVENIKFNPETNTLYFAYQMDVPGLASFGAGYDTYQITEYAE